MVDECLIRRTFSRHEDKVLCEEVWNMDLWQASLRPQLRPEPACLQTRRGDFARLYEKGKNHARESGANHVYLSPSCGPSHKHPTTPMGDGSDSVLV
jgi:hypothetical protein